MDALFNDFIEAQTNEIGYLLASTISPVPPKNDPGRLYALRRSGSEHAMSQDLSYKLQYNPGLRLDKDELKAWMDIYAAYFAFVARLLVAEETQNASNGQNANWVEVYNAWKGVVNVLLKAYLESILDAWTIPCLYTAGKYLRIFAIKADDVASSLRESGAIVASYEEEESDGGKNENLEDAARQINRIFSVCNGDRYV